MTPSESRAAHSPVPWCPHRSAGMVASPRLPHGAVLRRHGKGDAEAKAAWDRRCHRERGRAVWGECRPGAAPSGRGFPPCRATHGSWDSRVKPPVSHPRARPGSSTLAQARRARPCPGAQTMVSTLPVCPQGQLSPRHAGQHPVMAKAWGGGVPWAQSGRACLHRGWRGQSGQGRPCCPGLAPMGSSGCPRGQIFSQDLVTGSRGPAA